MKTEKFRIHDVNFQSFAHVFFFLLLGVFSFFLFFSFFFFACWVGKNTWLLWRQAADKLLNNIPNPPRISSSSLSLPVSLTCPPHKRPTEKKWLTTNRSTYSSSSSSSPPAYIYGTAPLARGRDQVTGATHNIGCFLLLIALLVGCGLGLVRQALLLGESLPALAQDLANLTCTGGLGWYVCRERGGELIPKAMPGFSFLTLSRCSFAKNM